MSAATIRQNFDAFLRLIHADDRERVSQQFAGAAQMREPVRINHRIQRPDGTVRWVQLRFAPIRDEAGRVVRVGGVIRDTTAEAELADAQQRARESAEAAARLKDEFLANMSHEIRTPLNGVIGTVDVLRESPLLPVQRAHIETIHACGNQLLSLVNDLLDFSKLEAGTLDVATTALDVGDIVGYVTQLFAAGAAEKGIDLSYQIDMPPLAGFRGDPEIVRQILTNLVSNAVKFTDAGRVTVRAGVADVAGAQTVLRFEVEDTGVGVAPAAQARIFEPFVQADASTSRRFEGTGLGLAIARRLVRLLGGALHVRSTLGSGSTFSFTAPVAAIVTEAAPEHRFPARRVLVAAARPEDRAAVAAALARAVGTVDQASSAEETRAGLAAAVRRGQPYDLLVVDVRTWGMAAVDFLRDVRQGMPDCPSAIGFISSGGRPGDAPALSDAGAAFHLYVPVRPQRLLDCLAALWESPEQSNEPLPVARRRAHILVVEDNVLNQRVAAAMIEWVGYSTEVVASGAAALDALERARFDAVLMDCQLPGMDGFATTGHIRERERGTGRRIPVIALTASATEAARQRCLAAGMDDYLTKPIRRPILAEMLARWTDTAGGDDAVTVRAVNRAHVQQMTDGDPAHLAQYTRMFHTEMAAGLRDIAGGADDNDAGRVLAVLHRLKGTAACVGAGAVIDTLSRVEDEVRCQGVGDMRAAAGQIEEAWRRFSAALTD